MVNAGYSQTMHLGNALPGLGRLETIRDRSGVTQYRLFLGFQAGGKLEMILGEAADKQAWTRFTPDLALFVSGIRFSGAIPAPGTQSAPDADVFGGGLSGWYVGSESSNSFNPNSGNWNFAASYSYYRFFPDGRVYWGWTLPKGMTMDAFDRAPDPNRMGNHGTYTISGGRIHLVWAIKARSPENWPFSRDRNSITMAGTAYYPIASSDNLRLAGTFGNSSYTTTSKGSGVSGSHSISFTSDGQFRAQGFTGSVNAGPVAAGTTSSTSSGTGTYRITGKTLELTYSGGRREEHSFYRYPMEDNKLIVIDGGMYLRR